MTSYTGGNMFIYYSSTQVRNRDFLGSQSGNLVLLPEEAERQRSERLAAHLSELGEEPNV